MWSQPAIWLWLISLLSRTCRQKPSLDSIGTSANCCEDAGLSPLCRNQNLKKASTHSSAQKKIFFERTHNKELLMSYKGGEGRFVERDGGWTKNRRKKPFSTFPWRRLLSCRSWPSSLLPLHSFHPNRASSMEGIPSLLALISEERGFVPGGCVRARQDLEEKKKVL